MTRRARLLTAPIDGSPLVLGYTSTEVEIPGTGDTVYFHFVGQQGMADGWFELLHRCKVFPGYIWGSQTYWSPNGQFLFADWYDTSLDTANRQFVAISLKCSRYSTIWLRKVLSVGNSQLHYTAPSGYNKVFDFADTSTWKSA